MQIGDRIRALRRQRGLSLAELADRVGTSLQHVSRLERGENDLLLRWLPPFARALRVRVVDLLPPDGQTVGLVRVRVTGEVEAGVWKDAAEWPETEQYTIEVPAHGPTPGARRFALRVAGRSMDLLYPEGTLVICAPLADVGRGPRSGDRVIVERRCADGRIEATCKEYVIDDRGNAWLWPRSTAPEHQQPIPLADQDTIEVRLSALVIGSYRPE